MRTIYTKILQLLPILPFIASCATAAPAVASPPPPAAAPQLADEAKITPTPATVTSPPPAAAAKPAGPPPRVGWELPALPEASREAFLSGIEYAIGSATLTITMPACGGKTWIYDSWAKVPTKDEPCECTVENYKAEGCFAVRWGGGKKPDAQSEGGGTKAAPKKEQRSQR